MFTHDHQAYNGEILGMGILFKSNDFERFITAPEQGNGITQTYMVSLKLTENKPVSFYFFAGWELQDINFARQDYFEDIMLKAAQQFEYPLELSKI
ncbi:MAG: DUF4861 domain-containing protein [Bacteroidales bacterium]|nr:DUF4861 domain-containing protein [Bacteroidales bacterium]